MDNGAGSYRRFLAGDDAGIVEIIRDYKDGLILFINRYVLNVSTAEELAEDVFFRLVTRKPRYVAKYSFKTWLYTIGRNTALNYLRRSKRSADELPDDTADAESLEREYIRKEQKIALHRALGRINPDYSRALYLKYFEELTNEQIAHVLGKNRRQVENLLYAAKQSLKTQLEKENFDYEDFQ